MQNYVLILSLYLRLYCIFQKTFVQLTKCNNYTFISILIITPLIDITIEILMIRYDYNHGSNDIVYYVFICFTQIYHLSLILIFIYLFLNKLYKIYKNNDNALLLEVTTKTTNDNINCNIFYIIVIFAIYQIFISNQNYYHLYV